MTVSVAAPLLLVGAYLLGSVSSGLWVGKLVAGVDVRREGSRRTGATNVQRVLGTRAAVAVAVLDLLKGAVAVLAVEVLLHNPYAAALAGLLAVVGHIWPVFSGFNGGRGVATCAGALAVLAPLPFICLFALMALVVLVTRYVSLASLTVAFAAGPVCAAWLGHGWMSDAALIVAVAGGSLVALKHADNLHRLLNGTERRLGARSPARPGTAIGGNP